MPAVYAPSMAFESLSDAYQKFTDAYGEPACCGRVHWSPDRLEQWLKEQRQWDGEWASLSPALVVKAAAVAWDDYCPE